MINQFVKSLFDGYAHSKKHKNDLKDWRFQELEQYPMLFSPDYLNECYDVATKKSEYESILDHLYNFNHVTQDSAPYQRIEQKIIDKYWRG